MTRKVVLDTDIFAAHLVAARSEFTALRSALSGYFCYTTVFNAVQLFATARTPRERGKVEDVLSAVKILGMNGRNAKKFSALDGFRRPSVPMETMIAGICIEARLPLMTARGSAYRRFRKLRVVPAPGSKPKRGGAISN